MARRDGRAVRSSSYLPGLVVFGGNALLNLIPVYPDKFKFIVLPGSYTSRKLKRVEFLAREYGIKVIRDSKFIARLRGEHSDLETLNVNVVGLLSQKVGQFWGLAEILSENGKKDSLSCIAFNDIDYPQNIGSILRTSYALGVDFVLIGNNQKLKVFSPTVTKVSMGSNLTIPIARENFMHGIEMLKKSNFDIIALDANGDSILDVNYGSRCCFILGNEERGLSRSVLDRADYVVSIPMRESAESLNVSVAAGIVLYDKILKNGVKG